GDELESRSVEKVEVTVDAALAARLSAHSADIVQLTREALSNVARHAQAGTAKVRLERDGARAVLMVEDAGIGFDARKSSAGNGMRNMHERAARLGGHMDVRSA